MRTYLVVVAAAICLLCVQGCCSSEPASAAPENPAGSSKSSATNSADAVAAYRAAMAAFNRGDKGAYFGAFTDPIECFHGKRDHPVERIKKKRKPGDLVVLYVKDIEVVASSDSEVRLVDRGMWIEETKTGIHEKAIVMRRVKGAWKIAGEGALNNPGCLGSFAGVKKAAWVKKCRALIKKCDKSCDEPCEYISNGCMACLEHCVEQVTACAGVTRIER